MCGAGFFFFFFWKYLDVMIRILCGIGNIKDNGNSHILLISNAMHFSEVWGGLFQTPVILHKFSFFPHVSKSDCTGQREKEKCSIPSSLNYSPRLKQSQH